MNFSSVYNLHESAVFEAVAATAARYPDLGDDASLLAEVACVALNRVPARYIGHSADPGFCATEQQRMATRSAIAESVEFAFGYVQAQLAMAARQGRRPPVALGAGAEFPMP